jgi:glycosidase
MSTAHEMRAPGVRARLHQHLARLYPPAVAEATCTLLLAIVEVAAGRHRQVAARLHRRAASGPAPLDETSVYVITYPDQVTEPETAPLRTLLEFLVEHVHGVIGGVHLLPFYPSTSDDGFAVADHLAVDPSLGRWEDVLELGRRFELMVDGVFNHVSAASDWFQRWRRGDPALDGFFIEVPPDTELSSVVRTRTSPLVTMVETTMGRRGVWTTFGADQIDLNYANPEVLLAMTQLLLAYAHLGARIIRLDAIGYLWKRLGSSCLHLPETHEVIRLWRTVLEFAAPGTALITETRGPHEQNVSYFGAGCDEADLVYQFELPPLVLDAFVGEDARTFHRWLADGRARPPCAGAAWFNVLGTHDGIGMRPAEGLLSDEQVARLIERTRAVGGDVTWVDNQDGSRFLFELNVSYFDALCDPAAAEPYETQLRRFVTAHALLLALPGVPGVYVQAMVGGRNWRQGVEQTGRIRTINRRKYDRASLDTDLRDPSSPRGRAMAALSRLLSVRRAEPAFHPQGRILPVDAHPSLCAFVRVAPDASGQVLCVHNVAGTWQELRVGRGTLPARGELVDLLDGQVQTLDGDGCARVIVEPYGHRWLRGGSPRVLTPRRR